MMASTRGPHGPVPPFPTGGVPKAMPEGAIGDVNSNARGSGARFNSGKPDLSLLPLRIVAQSYGNPLGRIDGDAIRCMLELGLWQETGNPKHLYAAIDALGGDKWGDAAKVFKYGTGKYAPWNWAKGMPWSVPLACAARHLKKVIELGEQDDDESLESHRGHVVCNIVMLLTYLQNYPEGDDRPRMLQASV